MIFGLKYLLFLCAERNGIILGGGTEWIESDFEAHV